MPGGIHLARLRLAAEVIKTYDGSLPFHHYLRQHFRENRQMGSRDRKTLSSLCYNYFRLGGNVRKKPLEPAIASAYYLLNGKQDDVLETFAEQGLVPKESAEGFLHDRIRELNAFWPEFSPGEIFPCLSSLSPSIDKDAFVLSHLGQPALWFRCRKAKAEEFTRLLESKSISFEQEGFSFKLPQGTDLEALCRNSHLYGEVQDLSSAQCLELLPDVSGKVWDCCAASGGKSLALLDRFPDIELSVSDLRDTMLDNLAERFAKAGLRKPFMTQADLSRPNRFLNFMRGNEIKKVEENYFDTIILDAPCSGSGTWARNPEHLPYFGCEGINRYTELQEKILSSVLPFLKPGGQLLYITCSAFAAENEEVTHAVAGLKLQGEQYLQGYAKGADTMYAALLG